MYVNTVSRPAGSESESKGFVQAEISRHLGQAPGRRKTAGAEGGPCGIVADRDPEIGVHDENAFARGVEDLSENAFRGLLRTIC